MRNIDVALEMYRKGEYKKAEKLFKQEAKKENCIAEYYLAFFLDYGVNNVINKRRALKWYKKSALHGYEKSAVIVANRYFKGEGCFKSNKKSFYWMKESMKSQNPCYQYNFAKYYLNGWGCKESKAKAFYWYIKSANQGCQEAQKVVKEWVW